MTGLFELPKRRKPFGVRTKKIEWMIAAGRDPKEYTEKGKFYKTSYCRDYRKCGTKLTWGDGSYNFDHKNNKSYDNSQNNCYLVCRNCHGKATKTKTVKVRDVFGIPVGVKKLKLKVGYKKPKSTRGKEL